MCEYCDISKYVCDYYGEADFDLQNELAIGDYTVLLMLYNSKTNKFGLKASGEGEAVIDINFCPKCGRNLSIEGWFHQPDWRKNMKMKPISKPVTMNNYKRFDPLYKCYCPKCNKILKRNEEVCTCGQEIDWSEWQ